MEMKLDSKKMYSLGEIVRSGFIPGVDTIPKASRLVKNFQAGQLLKPKIEPRGARGIQYKVKGANIQEYLKQENAKQK
jgi:hypothetical protein